MNCEFSNVKAVSKCQEDRQAVVQEKAALLQQVAQLTEDKRNLMLAVTDIFEMILPLLPDEGGTV